LAIEGTEGLVLHDTHEAVSAVLEAKQLEHDPSGAEPAPVGTTSFDALTQSQQRFRSASRAAGARLAPSPSQSWQSGPLAFAFERHIIHALKAGAVVAAVLQVAQPALPDLPSRHLKHRADCSLLMSGVEHRLQTLRLSAVVLSSVRQSTHWPSSAVFLL
jgi:hypothetical protein